ncbi:hypothetical protein [Photobacterium alginatilyticum]|uniref:Uncharacterized protein n=1 Tax=Photobacterium alginatilyticum TaxID=1775171 RepID=A0ABW9YQI9_9GAMM|nr:hypothetical protein [Photobacterium alginatilyticum]NBI56217.1 hypothetical protein [Photobacterium alginatilyticum]
MLSDHEHEDVDALDHLFVGNHGNAVSKPDYFLFNRSVILEKKTLSNSPEDKINVWLNEEAKVDNELASIFRGTMHVEDIISAHPDKTFRRKVINRAYRGYRNDVMRHANKQLRISSKHLGFDNAVKGLLVLNEAVSAFKHDSLVIETEKALYKPDSKLDSIDFVIIISETDLEHKSRNFMCSVLIDDKSESGDYIEMIISKNLLIKWSIYNNRPICFVEN